nr:MAG TPA: hypothetical protein [Caudoviricetes sp.]
MRGIRNSRGPSAQPLQHGGKSAAVVQTRCVRRT